jgi:hypothetical protein
MKKVYSLYYKALMFYLFACKTSFAQPEWLNSPQKLCNHNNLCAVGSGANLSEANTNAKANILKQFETNISSDFVSKEIAVNNNSNTIISDKIEEKANGIINAVKIENNYNDGKQYFSFATLDKQSQIKTLLFDIEEIDKKIIFLSNNQQIQKIKKLQKQRLILNKRYLFLTGTTIPEKVKYEQQKKHTYYITSDSKKEEDIINILKLLITEDGSKISNNKSEADRYLLVKLDSKKLYLNIDSFEKYLFSITIDSYEANNLIGTITTNISETGRDKEQTYEKILPKVKNYLEENLDQI